jgi:beta-lactamase regulating signal transducer with metallopeptidase domain
MEWLIGAAARGAAVLVVASVASVGLRRASASTRHLLWAVTVSALLALPVLSSVTPNLNVLPASLVQRASDATPPVAAGRESPAQGAAPAVVAADAGAPAPALTVTGMVPPTPRYSLTSAQILFALWLTGVLLVLSGIAFAFARVRALTRGARPVSPELAHEITRIAREMGVARVVAVTGAAHAMPMTWGIVTPRLLLPESANAWPRARLHAVLRHELAHIRRRDPFWQLVGETACALHWFNPLAWHAARRLRVEREHACDDAVLMAGARASDYASELLEIARTLRSPRAASLAAIAMAQPRQLEGRLLAVLDETRERRVPSRKWRVWLAAGAVIVPVAALRPATTADFAPVPFEVAAVHARTESGAKAKKPALFPNLAASANAAALAPMVAVVKAEQDRCPTRGRKNNVSINSHEDDNGLRSVKWETGSCKGSMVMNGKVRIAGDLTGIESISPGGGLTLTETRAGTERELKVRPNGKQLVYTFEIDGKSQPWNAEGRTWLASVLEYLVRRVGFGADERVDYLLKQGGLNAVLREIGEMDSDYVQRQYFNQLLDKTAVNSGALETVLTTASRTLQSDYEMAELLLKVAKKYEFTEAVRRVYINAAGALESDYEHRRALSAVLLKGGLSSDNVSAILVSSKALESDYENAELLLSVADRYRLDPQMRAAYLDAAANLRSDYEKGRVFKVLLAQGEPSSAESSAVLNALSSMKSDYELRQVLMSLVARPKLTTRSLDVVLASATRIGSDYERAELLMAVLRKHELTPEQRQRVVTAADGLRSEYERGRVSSLLLKQMN